MSYNRENYIRIRAEFDKKHLARVNDALERRASLQAELPGLREIDEALAETGARVYSVTLACRGDKDRLQREIAELRKDNEALLEARAALLRENGYPENETDPHFDCPKCEDRGIIGTKMCSCMKDALIKAGYESSGIGKLIEKQSFETFDVTYYPEAEREHIGLIVQLCRDYAECFASSSSSSSGTGNLLFRGNTGLGKTHLSTSIAKRVTERGFDVLYDTAQNIFSDFETDRFRPGSSLHSGSIDRYFSCELLIIDDLGTEMTNSFTVACLYNIINTRINNGRPIIINTNLSWNDLRARYADRITSRLFGEFTPLEFAGNDIRGEKLKG